MSKHPIFTLRLCSTLYFIIYMTGTERILEVMRIKNLNNVQFSAATGIATASLSHLTSGRSNPTLQMYEKIIAAFPDIDPTWLTYGTGTMFRRNVTASVDPTDGTPVASPTPYDSNDTDGQFYPSDAEAPIADGGTASVGYGVGGDIFAVFDEAALQSASAEQTSASSSSAHRPSAVTSSGAVAGTSRPSSPQTAGRSPQVSRPATSALSIADVVRETLAVVQRPQRKIIEVRIFFDDGTYESFGGPK